MKILIAAPGFDSWTQHEVSIFALDQAKALRDAGHEVRFAAIDTRSIRRVRPLGFFRYLLDGIPVYYGAIPCGKMPGKVSSAAAKLAASGTFRMATRDGWRPDVIHQHFGTSYSAMAAQNKIPLVATEHASWHNRILSEKTAGRLKKEYACCAAVLAVSQALAEKMRINTGVSPKVVANIADTALFAREKHGHDGFRFVSTGNLIASKNMDGLIRAFARLSGEPELVIFGDGEERKSLCALCETLGVAERVTLRGQCPRGEIAQTYAESDCFVLASRSETFGVAYIEAMAAGLPVIATRCGGPEDFVTEENGVLVPVNDETALAEAMESLMHSAGQYDSRKISADICRRYSPEEIARELTEIYKEVVLC